MTCACMGDSLVQGGSFHRDERLRNTAIRHETYCDSHCARVPRPSLLCRRSSERCGHLPVCLTNQQGTCSLGGGRENRPEQRHSIAAS